MSELTGQRDGQLVEQAKLGDQTAVETLLRRYKPLVSHIASKYRADGSEHDDLLQEGMIGLYSAIRHFDAQRDISFEAFAGVCVKRSIFTLLKAARRQKNFPLSGYLSLDSTPPEDAEDEGSFQTTDSPEDILIAREDLRAVLELVSGHLSKLEESVFLLYVNGYSYSETAKRLGVMPKVVDNALARVKRKLKSILA